ncbi:MAG: LysM peptidoglycan-binding domain-containing protein [Jatrophihabitans sp.]
MSVATEFPPSVRIPARSRPYVVGSACRELSDLVDFPTDLPVPVGAPARSGSITVLRPPADAGRVPVRLTRRGVLVVAVFVACLGAVLVWLAAASAPAVTTAPTGPAVVTVQPGDTLWSIAGRAAPDRDPRAEVDHLRALNQLDGATLEPGQQIRTR